MRPHVVRLVQVGSVGRRGLQIPAALLGRHAVRLAKKALEERAILCTQSTASGSRRVLVAPRPHKAARKKAK